mgnify:CR=1 FL=1
MRNKHHRGIHALVQITNQIQNLCLDRHIQRRDPGALVLEQGVHPILPRGGHQRVGLLLHGSALVEVHPDADDIVCHENQLHIGGIAVDEVAVFGLFKGFKTTQQHKRFLRAVLHTDQVELFKRDSQRVILGGVCVFDLDRLFALAVIPALGSGVELAAVEEVLDLAAVQRDPEGALFLGDHLHLDGFHGVLVAALGGKVHGHPLACGGGDGGLAVHAALEIVGDAGFNKVRMCVFPKNYSLVKDEPALYPFEIRKTIKDKEGNERKEWDFDRFDPAFFQHLEKRIDQLNRLGIEADLILFHPYDKGRWGFDAMSNEVNVRYIKYITARLASFRNVWWSMANEWDYVKAKTVDDWKLLTKTVVENDPYRHLCSIHGATATYFDYWMPEFTHVSIQDEAPVLSSTASATLRKIYRKPVICDEVGYEGNLPYRWGRLSPQQMTCFILNGLLGGIYVTHGECYQQGNEPIFWAQGGSLKGESWKRVKFLRTIIEAAPHPLEMADISRDLVTSTAGPDYYLVNMGKDVKGFWTFNLPVKNADYNKLQKNKRFKVEIIDVWAMTVTEYPVIFETTEELDYRVFDIHHRGVRIPDAPYIVLRITEVK